MKNPRKREATVKQRNKPAKTRRKPASIQQLCIPLLSWFRGLKTRRPERTSPCPPWRPWGSHLRDPGTFGFAHFQTLGSHLCCRYSAASRQLSWQRWHLIGPFTTARGLLMWSTLSRFRGLAILRPYTQSSAFQRASKSNPRPSPKSNGRQRHPTNIAMRFWLLQLGIVPSDPDSATPSLDHTRSFFRSHDSSSGR